MKKKNQRHASGQEQFHGRSRNTVRGRDQPRVRTKHILMLVLDVASEPRHGNCKWDRKDLTRLTAVLQPSCDPKTHTSQPRYQTLPPRQRDHIGEHSSLFRTTLRHTQISPPINNPQRTRDLERGEPELEVLVHAGADGHRNVAKAAEDGRLDVVVHLEGAPGADGSCDGMRDGAYRRQLEGRRDGAIRG
eukprot:3000086-Rhodomonas_salina.1